MIAIPAAPAAPQEPELPDTLPPVRQDLRLHAGAPNHDGSPAWTIQDPVNNLFYRIGWVEFELLSRWHAGSPQALLASAQAETLLQPSAEELQALLRFLAENHLLALRGQSATEQLLTAYRKSRLGRLQWLLHHYLFFRIPLWHPDRWLQRALPWVQWVYRPATAWTVLGLSLLGLILTFRQFDTFAASLVDTLSPGGLLGYLLALAVTKSLHELGHAFTATRYGVRVAHTGVAFLVLWPMLYTDTGESWRLHDRRQRLAIASAGILSELAVAGLATLAWNLAEPGDLRQSLFFLATTAWLLSLTLNASPFMRFDGYFILSDLLDLPNLHERSFALARTWLRNRLLGWEDPDPEDFPPVRRRSLIAFAIATWLYRLLLFLGIAVAVYYFFFKLLGIVLFIVEIWWFVARPIANELRVWKTRQAEIRPSHKRRAALAALAAFIVALVPWDLSVRATAWAHAEDSHLIYSPLPARILDAPDQAGTALALQAPLFALENPEARLRARVGTAGSEALGLQLAGIAALPDGEEKRRTLEEQQALRSAEATAGKEELARLQLTAPTAGVLADLDPEARPGVWVSPRQPLATVVAPETWTAEALVGQHDLPRLTAGDTVRFYPEDNPLFPLHGRIESIDGTRLAGLPHPMLSSRHGGSLAVLADAQGLTPRDALYRVRVRLEGHPDRLAVRRGTAVIDAAPRSWLVEAGKSLLVVLIREASF